MAGETNALKSTGFALVGIGTAGLLLNEFVLDRGTPAVLLFAAANVTGLLGLWFSFSRRK